MRNETCKACDKNFSVYDSRPPAKYCSVVCKIADYKKWHAVTLKTYIHPKKEKIIKKRFKWIETDRTEQLDHLKKIFERSVIKQDGCWDWNGGNHSQGYIPMKDGKKFTWAHRISWIINFGEIKDGLWVLHKCDNKRCTNPEHLFLGTCQDNIDDMDNKGRRNTPKGINHINAKLTDEKVKKIKELLNLGVTVARICKDYNMSNGAIDAIKYGKTWKHVK